MKAYFSCGAGDFIAIESFLTDIEKRRISSFHLFTRAAETIEKIIRTHPIWRELPVHIPMVPGTIRDYGAYSFFDIENLRKVTKKPWTELDIAIDFSGDKLYPDILSGVRKYNKSEFHVKPLRMDAVIDPESHADDRLVKRGRNFTEAEIAIAVEPHKYIAICGIGLTSVEEAMGFVAGCTAFYGVDSMLAAWAARQPKISRIVVKSVNPIYTRWLPIYDPHRKIEVVNGIHDIIQ